MKNNTYSVLSRIVSTVKKSHATITLGLSPEELRPARPAAPRRRAQPASPQQRPNRRGAYPDAELAQLPADPDAAPARVLPCHPQHQRDDLGVEWWPARSARLPVGPLASHEFAVPAQQRLRGDQEQ